MKKAYSYINAKLSAEIDFILMKQLNFSSQQLMELAGLSVANVVYDFIIKNQSIKKITVISGPGSKNIYYIK